MGIIENGGLTHRTELCLLRSRRDEASAFLPDNCQHYLTERALDSSWYPEADFLELIKAASCLFPTTRTQALMMIGRESLNMYVRDKKRSRDGAR